MRALVVVLSMWWVVGCADSVEVRDVKLVMPELTLNVRRPNRELYSYQALSGFGCVNQKDGDEPKGEWPFLYWRAYTVPKTLLITELKLAMTVVVDTIRLGGYPRCRVSEIYAFCSEPGRSCEPIAQERQCFDLPVVAVPVTEDAEATLQKIDEIFVSYVKDGLAGQLVAGDAIDEEVMYRVVGTTQTCAELEEQGGFAFDPARLTGCSYSCPLVPSAARGDILLDLDAIVPTLCEPSVRACASDQFQVAPVGTLPTDPVLTTQ